MPSEVDQGCSPSSSSSYFSAEIHFPAQRKVGFWKSEDLLDNLVSVDTTLLPGKGSCLSQKNSGFVQLGSAGGKESKVDLNGFPYENGLFSSSLPELFHRRSTNYALFDQSLGMTNANNEEDEPTESLKEIEAQTIGNLLPDDDELLSDVVEERENTTVQNGMNDFEDDLFSSTGGLELESNGVSSASKGDMNNLFSGYLCEPPSRTLSVCNVNSSAEDSDLRVLFQRYGDIHTLITANKHHGFVMVSYYDVRSACNAVRALQNMIFMHKKLDLHFLTVKEHPPHKDINQRAFVLVSLNSSFPNDDLYQAFGAYGEIKKISDSSSRYDKIIEFYDVRAAEAARCALRRSGIARKQIMPESTHPINTRCSLPQQFSYNLEQELANGYHKKGSSPSSSPSLHYGTMPFGAIMSNGLDSGAIQGKCSVSQGSTGPLFESGFSRNSSSVPHYLSSPVRISSLEKHSNHVAADDLSHSLGHMNFGIRSMPGFRPHSLPDYHDGLGTICSSPLNFAGQSAGVDKIQISGLNSTGFSGVSFPNSDLGNSGGHLHGRQYLPRGPIMWPTSPSFTANIPTHPASQLHGLPMAPSSIFNTGMPVHHHHVGSAPAANPSLWERRGGFKGSLVEAPGFHPNSHENMGLSGSSPLHPLEFSPHNVFPHVGGNFLDSSMSSSHAGIGSPQQNCHIFHGGRSPKIPMPASFGTPGDRFRSRRSDTSLNQVENKKQYELDIECIIRGEDTRTTLMIKNIPNKYTSKMLLAAIDEHHRGTYDFIYLPIDFKNKCNVGYAFINIINPQQIIPFYKAFNGKKWEKFNSEKVASLAYARIQGKTALIAHFQNSSLMNEDKRCRPILFHSDGPNAGDQEPFPVGINVRSRSGRPRTQTNDDNHDGSPSNSSNGEEHSIELHSAANSVERLNE